MRTLFLTLTTCLFVLPAYAKYSGGTGEPNDPYQIATAGDLIVLGETPDDYDKHFVLTADIDLDPNLPGRKVFDKAVIAPDTNPASGFQGTSFTGVFDGNGYTISHLTVAGTGNDYLGLFGGLGSAGGIMNLRVADINVTASDGAIGALVGLNEGTVTRCSSSGTVTGGSYVGGLVGHNTGYAGIRGYVHGRISQCHTASRVIGSSSVGGLVGDNEGTLTNCYSTGAVTGDWAIGGLVGDNDYTITNCYSTGAVSGGSSVGGLVGENHHRIDTSYSTGTVGGNSSVGGLVGSGNEDVSRCVWDIETSGLSGSAGGVGLTTAEMMNHYMLGLNGFASDPNWVLDAGRDYPRLAWEGTPGQIIPDPAIDWLEGTGAVENPYQIDTAEQLILLGKASILWEKHFVLDGDIDLDPNLPAGQVFAQAVIPAFSGVFDGNGHTISHLTINGGSSLGLFGLLERGAEVSDLGVVDVNITGSGYFVGGLAGYNDWGSLTHCYSTGLVSGSRSVGGLVGGDYGNIINCHSTGSVGGVSGIGGLVGGKNRGSLTDCHSTCTVGGESSVGGLVGENGLSWIHSTVTRCYSVGTVNGGNYVGGLVGYNYGSITASYSSGPVIGDVNVGGLVGENNWGIDASYSTSVVSGDSCVGGLVGQNYDGTVTQCYSTGAVSGAGGGLVGAYYPLYSHRTVNQATVACFWDTQTSGQAASAGGTGMTTAELRTAKTFLEAGWDFVDETANGTEDLWWILEGKDYPRLWWENAPQ